MARTPVTEVMVHPANEEARARLLALARPEDVPPEKRDGSYYARPRMWSNEDGTVTIMVWGADCRTAPAMVRRAFRDHQIAAEIVGYERTR